MACEAPVARTERAEGTQMSLFVRDVMSRGVVTCQLDTPIEEIASRMCKARATAIVVVDNIGEVAGIISRTDLARVFVASKGGRRAEDIMTGNVITIVPHIPVQAAVELMLDHKIHQLVILHAKPAPGRPVGLLSMDDVVRLLAEPGRYQFA
jgi:CBS domain-containing protein